MKLEISRVDLSGQSAQAVMTHRGQPVLEWNLSLFEKLEKSTTRQREQRNADTIPNFDIFEQINSFWAHQKEAMQDKIYDVFYRIKQEFLKKSKTDVLTKALYPLIAELFTYHSFDEVKHWYDFYSTLTIHPNWDLKDTFPENRDSNLVKDRTYLKDHYRQLTMLAVAVRAMIPVWGEFINLTHREKGTALKEYYAFKLLSFSEIMHWLPMERLRQYVEASLPGDKSHESAILGAISSEDIPVWVLSLVVVRRLAVADLRGMDPNSHLVTFIFKYIGQKVKGADNSFMGMIKPKQVEGQSQDGENNLSKLEGYKVKQEIPAGDTEMMAFDMRNHGKIIERICPDLLPQTLQLSMASVRQLENQDLHKPQILVLQQVLRKVLNPRGVEYLNKQQVLDLLGLAQAMLWHRGHFELAALMTGIAVTNEDEVTLGVENRTRVPKEMKDLLLRYWPFTKRTNNKSKQPPTKNANVAEANIDILATEFSKCTWTLTLPTEWVVKLTGNPNDRSYSAPHDIKVKLAALAIATAERRL